MWRSQPHAYTTRTVLSIRHRNFRASSRTFSVCLRISSSRDICSLLLGSTRFSKSACERIERHQSASRFLSVQPTRSLSFDLHSTHHLGLGCSCSHGCSHTRHFGACWSSFVRFLASRVRPRLDRAVASPSFVPRTDKKLPSVFFSFPFRHSSAARPVRDAISACVSHPLLVTPRTTCTPNEQIHPFRTPGLPGQSCRTGLHPGSCTLAETQGTGTTRPCVEKRIPSCPSGTVNVARSSMLLLSKTHERF